MHRETRRPLVRRGYLGTCCEEAKNVCPHHVDGRGKHRHRDVTALTGALALLQCGEHLNGRPQGRGLVDDRGPGLLKVLVTLLVRPRMRPVWS